MSRNNDCLLNGNLRDGNPSPPDDSRRKRLWTPWNGTSFWQQYCLEENTRLQSFRSWNDYNPYEQTQVYSFTVLKLWRRFLIRHNSLPNRPSFLCTSSCTYRMHLTLWGHHPDVVKHLVSALDGFDEFAFGAKGSSPIFFLLYKRLVMGLRGCIW